MRRAFWPLAVFPVAFGAASFFGGYPWPLALLTALAVAALTYSTEGSVRRLAVLYRHDGAADSGPWSPAPGKERQGEAEQHMHGGGGGRPPEEKAQPDTEQATGNQQSKGG